MQDSSYRSFRSFSQSLRARARGCRKLTASETRTLKNAFHPLPPLRVGRDSLFHGRANGICAAHSSSIRCSIRFGMIRASRSLPPRLRRSRGQLLSMTKREIPETRQEQCSCRLPARGPSAFAIVRGSSQKRPIGPFSGVRFTGASWSCLHSAPSLLPQPDRATTPGSRR